MRVGQAEGYVEPRDCLAQDWARYLTDALPDHLWMPIPNLGAATVDYAAAWGLDGLILTGGNDLGTCPTRDVSERALLAYAMKKGFPVLGVCRGLQLIQTHFGGALQSCRRDNHVATNHPVRIHTVWAHGCPEQEALVNSFHSYAVDEEELAPALSPFAWSQDGWVEGLYHPSAPVFAVQWHPEREGPSQDLDRDLMRWIFMEK